MIRRACLVAVAAAILTSSLPISSALAQQGAAVNRGVVELETSSSSGISVRIAEDIASLVDDGATRRVVPVVGKGSLQNLTDLKYLRGIDMAIVQTDMLDYTRDQRMIPGIENSLTYITKLYNEEFHLLARPEIKSLADLANRKVNVDLRATGTAFMASRLFELLKLPVITTNENEEVALERLHRGEIAALAFVAGKPAPLLNGLRGDDGLHLITIPFPRGADKAYSPSRLTEADYPNLIRKGEPIDTVAVGSVLVATDLRKLPDRDRNVANFVDVFFNGFQSLLSPGHHPKWREINIAAELPGWRRYPAADQWLQRNVQVAKPPNPEELKQMFARFIDERRQAAGGPPMTQQDKDSLFRQFQTWQRDRAQ